MIIIIFNLFVILILCREQCEELRAVETKHRHNEITKQRSEQVRLKTEKEQYQKEGIAKVAL